MSVFESIKNSRSLLDYLASKGYEVKRLGNGYQLEECPFCHGHNCFRIYSSGKKWSCFQCPDRKIGKDIIDLEYYFSGDDYGKVIRDLASSLGIEYAEDELVIVATEIKNVAMKYYKAVLADTGKTKDRDIQFKGKSYSGTTWDYLTGLRKHSEDCIDSACIGLADGSLMDYLIHKGYELKQIRASGLVKNDRDLFKDGLIVFPHFVNGKVSHFTCKDPSGRMDPFQVEVRFRDPAWRFYNQDIVLDDLEDKSLVLVEGENDLLSVVYKAGVANCIAQIGQYSDEQIRYLRNLSSTGWAFVLAHDGDEQGKKYRNIIIEQVGGNIYDIPISVDGIGEGSDIDDILCAASDSQKTFEDLLLNLDKDPKLYKVKSVSIKKQETTATEEKIPSSIEHERFLLRNLIRGDFLDVIFSRFQSDKVLFKSLYQKMFTAIKDLYNQGKTVNELISYTMFWDLKILKDDEEYSEIMLDTFQSDIDSALDILEKKWERRNLLDFSVLIAKKANDESIEIDKVQDEVSKKFYDLSSVRLKSDTEINASNILEKEFVTEGGFKVVGTPYEDINSSLVLGFDTGQIIIVAGRTGMGKSSLKTVFKKYWAENQYGIIDFSPENTVKVEQARLDSMVTGIPFKKVFYRKKGDEVDLACQEFHVKMVDEKWPLWQNQEREKLTLDFINTKVRQCQKERSDVKNWIVVIDLADKVREFKAGRDQWSNIERGLAKLIDMSNKTGFCPVLLIQIGRSVENEKKIAKRRPEISDLRGSGGWENAADMIYLLFREKYYDRTIETDVLEINLAKQRNGPVAIFEKLFIEDCFRIEDKPMEGSYEELPPD